MGALLDWAYQDFVNDFASERLGTTLTAVVVVVVLISVVFVLVGCGLSSTPDGRADEEAVRTRRVRVTAAVGGTALTLTATWVTACRRRSLSNVPTGPGEQTGTPSTR